LVTRNQLEVLQIAGSQNTIFGNNVTTYFFPSTADSLFYENNFPYPKSAGTEANRWDNGTIGNYWLNYNSKYPNATQIDNTGLGDTPYLIDDNNTDHNPLMFPSQISMLDPIMATHPIVTSAPTIEITSPSPNNKSYNTTFIPLVFCVDATNWICFSLDNQANVTISGNVTLTDIGQGNHSLIVYASGTFGNIEKSNTTSFSIAPPTLSPSPPPTSSPTQQPTQELSPTPTTNPYPDWIPYVILAVVLVGIGASAVYIKRRKRAT